MRIWLIAICLLPWLMLAQGASRADSDHMEARRLVESGRILSLEQVLESVHRQWPGRILEVELETKHRGYVYEIELLDLHGHVWEMKVDAVSGKILRSEQEE
jgi:uncharacterized membrane protein YkoI